MEHWHTNSSAPYQREPGDLTLGSRVLTSSSGNIQTYNPESKDGIENQDPLQLSRRPEPWPKQEIQYPIPEVKLGSNDAHGENLAHLQQRRQNQRDKFYRRRRVDPARPYLQHAKYLQYRARQRCDTGPDGKPVWDDRIEDAFQNALVNIPPMGRRKKSQRGRPHGRNELISEWIFQETGEYRTRKQVSSHIQVLNTLLKDIPEWNALVTASDDRGGGGSEYYSDSIKDMVRSQSISSRHYNRGYSRPAHGSYSMPSGNGYVDRYSCSRLSFKMWVSLPEDISQALHLYTRLQSNSSSSPMPLEDVKNWRNSYPSLRSVMESWTLTDSCDIILLDTSFQLMTDFPPKHSKLGISLELDFMHPSGHNKEALSTLTKWNCVTQIYQHGRLIKETRDMFPGKDLPPGKIRPFFESRWWASTFTTLTEKRKRAEDSESDGAVEVANEASRNFFRGLTVMQEITAEMKSKDVYDTPRLKRMGILLWRFSQAAPEYVGTTTWQKLIPPAEMMDARGETSISDMGLPTMGIDTTMDAAQNADLFTHPQGFMPMQSQQDYDMFDTSMDDLCHDGFMYGQDQLTDFGSFQNDGASFTFESGTGLNGDLSMGYSMPTQEAQHPSEPPSQQSTNLFEMPQIKQQEPDRQLALQSAPQHDSYNPPTEKSGTQPLAKFDMNTHKVLQAQLGAEHYYSQQLDPPQQPPSRHSAHPSPHQHQQASQAQHPPPTPHLDDHDETVRALLAASAMSDLGNSTSANQSSAQANRPSATTASSTKNILATTRPGPPSITYSRAPLTLHAPQPLYIPTSQPFTGAPTPPLTAGSATSSHHHQHLHHPHPHHQPISHPLSAPIRPPLQAHHSFTNVGAMDARTTAQHHRHVPSKPSIGGGASFAAALANLDAYSSSNELAFGVPHHGAYDQPSSASVSGGGPARAAHGNGAMGLGGAGAGEEISRPQSQPVLSVSVPVQIGDGAVGMGMGLGLGAYEPWENVQNEVLGSSGGHGQHQQRQQRQHPHAHQHQQGGSAAYTEVERGVGQGERVRG